MIIVCDSSPVVALSICNCLSLLDSLFHDVIIPHLVYNEMTVSGKPESAKIASWGHDKTAAAQDIRLLNAFNLVLDAGEAEAIALYWEKSADFLLIDEKKGRKIAAQSGINITGSLGILLMAKENGLIPALKPFIELLQKSKARISESLYAGVLELAEEL